MSSKLVPKSNFKKGKLWNSFLFHFICQNKVHLKEYASLNEGKCKYITKHCKQTRLKSRLPVHSSISQISCKQEENEENWMGCDHVRCRMCLGKGTWNTTILIEKLIWKIVHRKLCSIICNAYVQHLYQGII